jgi:hypothetical protein
MKVGGAPIVGLEGGGGTAVYWSAITSLGHYTQNQFRIGVRGRQYTKQSLWFPITPSSEIHRKMTLILLSLISYLISLFSYLFFVPETCIPVYRTFHNPVDFLFFLSQWLFGGGETVVPPISRLCHVCCQSAPSCGGLEK